MDKIKENKTQQNIQRLVEQFLRISNKIDEAHGKTLKLQDGHSLSIGEIHFIECIGKHPEANLTEIAAILGNTRGAASQMAKKLEKKGLVSKEKRGSNQKDIYLRLSNSGYEAYQEHEKLHTDMYRDIADAMGSVSEEKFKEIQDIFEIIERHMDRY